MGIPLGLRFEPLDHELLRFLFDFVTGRSSVDDELGLIHHEDIFSDKEPWELIRYGPSEKKVYFFTKLKKKGKSMTGSRVERTVGKKVNGGKRSGNWHGQDKGKAVVDEKGKIVMGFKRSFIYKNETEAEQDRQWLLKEFSLPETIIKKAKAKYPIVEERKDFVLCRLRRKKLEQGYDYEEEEEEEEETFFEQGTSSNGGFEGVPVPVPFPADGSHLAIVPVPVPVETTNTTLQIADQEGDPFFTLAPAPAPAGDADDDDGHFAGCGFFPYTYGGREWQWG